MNTRREFPRNVAVGVSGSVRRVVRPVCAPAARRGPVVQLELDPWDEEH
jgi:hypothetical protein